MLAEKARLTEEMVDLGFETNGDGAGIAWRDGAVVRWEKGLSLARIQELAAVTPLPYIAHFRIQTVGGKRPELTHPFPIDKTAPLHLKGSTKGAVLFHNGHWTDWKKMILEASIKTGVKLPAGKWSDSRAMAWLASVYGVGILEFIGDDKSVALSPTDIDFQGLWVQVGDYWCSNRHWEHRRWRQVGNGVTNGTDSRTMCRHSTCSCTLNLDSTGYCPLHTVKKQEAATIVFAEIEDAKKKEEVKGSGGNPTGSPFEQEQREFEAALKSWQNKELSNKKFKKIRHKYEEARRQWDKDRQKQFLKEWAEKHEGQALTKH